MANSRQPGDVQSSPHKPNEIQQNALPTAARDENTAADDKGHSKK
jgi:hypothetical protein